MALKVVPIRKFCDLETIGALRHLLTLAELGEVHGLAACVKDNKGRETHLFTGDFRRDPAAGAVAALSLSWQLTRHSGESPP